MNKFVLVMVLAMFIYSCTSTNNLIIESDQFSSPELYQHEIISKVKERDYVQVMTKDDRSLQFFVSQVTKDKIIGLEHEVEINNIHILVIGDEELDGADKHKFWEEVLARSTPLIVVLLMMLLFS
ncbi:hypothetical protein RGQ13_01660 [Thalassotalea psychrophila]|uniref:Lipoprotein n=1 Tax=Thalassotalea psychrophila TaxID=3065647 RepID=A0ABY9TVA4_9GAMM|nr:hypothetical protein RGQ13_01660 [Colwelliaceae bacterium SQ149]